MIYREPADALAEFRISGGAMLFHHAGPCGERNVFEVLDADDAAERLAGTDVTVREATENALRECDLTDAEIETEMADWIG